MAVIYKPLPGGGGGGGSTSPGGSSGDIQFNDGGSFGGFGDWNGTIFTAPGDLRLAGDEVFIGALPSDADQKGIWLGESAAAPTNTNHSLLVNDNGATFFNSDNRDLWFTVSNSPVVKADNTGFIVLYDGQIRPNADSTNAVRFQSAAGTTDLLTIDTSNGGVKIPSLLVGNSTAAPLEGGMYFNRNANDPFFVFQRSNVILGQIRGDGTAIDNGIRFTNNTGLVDWLRINGTRTAVTSGYLQLNDGQIRPDADSTEAIVFQNTAGTLNLLTINTSGNSVGTDSTVGVDLRGPVRIGGGAGTVAGGFYLNRAGNDPFIALEHSGTRVATIRGNGSTSEDGLKITGIGSSAWFAINGDQCNFSVPIRPITDSTSALQFQNAAGSTDIATFNTTDNQLKVRSLWIGSDTSTALETGQIAIVNNRPVAGFIDTVSRSDTRFEISTAGSRRGYFSANTSTFGFTVDAGHSLFFRTAGATDATFETDATERMRIRGDGNSIQTTVPLEVNVDGAASGFTVLGDGVNDASGATDEGVEVKLNNNQADDRELGFFATDIDEGIRMRFNSGGPRIGGWDFNLNGTANLRVSSVCRFDSTILLDSGVIRPTADSITAYQFRAASGTDNLLTIDSTNGAIYNNPNRATVTYLGQNAGIANTSGTDWTALGQNAGSANVSGSGWTAIGNGAGSANTTGSNWLAMGRDAGNANIDGENWFAIGRDAGSSNASGSNWFALGNSSGAANTTGGSWTAIGPSAGLANTTGSSWTAIGRDAGNANIGGSNWVAVGRAAGKGSAGNGGNFVAVGRGAGEIGDSSNYVYLGYEAGYAESTNNRLHIANNRNSSLLLGDFSNNTLMIGSSSLEVPTAAVDLAASTTTRASLRIRTGVAPTSPNDGEIWSDGSDLFVRLGGVTYTLDKT